MSKSRYTVLIVEDNDLNRDILATILGEEFEILEAKNGQEGLKVLQENVSRISVVLLDLEMPIMNGYQMLQVVKEDELLREIPIIVMTSKENADEEERCLDLGAYDFAQKPYSPRVVIQHIRNIIRLRESASTLNAIEIEAETGVYTRGAFFHYADKLLKKNPDVDYALIMVDIKGFSTEFNKWGSAYVQIIKKEADQLRKSIPDDAICGHYYLERFIALSPIINREESDRKKVVREFIAEIESRVGTTLKFAVYENISHEEDILTSVQYVQEALNNIKSLYNENVSLVDEALINKFERRTYIEEHMQEALANGEIEVYFQPKHSAKDGKIVGAETLMRWCKSGIGFISPGEFVPLFEENGFIVEADAFACDETCRYLRKWIDQGLDVVPISVNTSRYDYTKKNFQNHITESVKRYNIDPELIHIEITESLFQDLSNEATEILKTCRRLGIKIELDDFGTGYSSLHSLAELPIDIVKFDQSFIRKLSQPREQIVMRGCMDIVKSLNLHTVAEGVETEENLLQCIELGIDSIQGYYYSKPLPASEFEKYIG